VGGGHLSAARALADELESTGLVSARLADIYLESGRFPLGYFPAGYARLARSHPHIWTALYRSTERADPTAVLNLFLRSGVDTLLRTERPDLVVSVLPLVNGVLAEATAQRALRLEVVLTDWFHIHRLWIAPGVQHYTAPTEAARKELIRRGVDPESIDSIGIPIRSTFAEASGGADLRARVLTGLQLDPARFTLLAMVGAEGSPAALRNVARLSMLDLPAQLIVICGRNETLRQKVARLPARIPVRALGFVNTIPDLMRAADVVVTKAGGLTLAEAFSCGAPVVVHDILPGQEAGNLEYALRNHAAEFGATPAELERIVRALYADPDRRQRLAERGARLARPAAARQIAENILRRAELLG
jgi:UDP-N-acetylglucosamine:LPS N-acetylglucosamine transferase